MIVASLIFGVTEHKPKPVVSGLAHSVCESVPFEKQTENDTYIPELPAIQPLCFPSNAGNEYYSSYKFISAPTLRYCRWSRGSFI